MESNKKREVSRFQATKTGDFPQPHDSMFFMIFFFFFIFDIILLAENTHCFSFNFV